MGLQDSASKGQVVGLVAKNRIYIVRHGHTNLNSDAKGQERFRGWADVPLNDEGIDSAHEAGEFLKDKGITKIFASNLTRTEQTAKVLHAYTGAPVEAIPGLRPWHIGKFSGEPVEPNKKEFNHYHDNKNEKIPGGESYNDFYTRFGHTLHTLMQLGAKGETIAAVTHTRNVNAINHLLTGGKAKIEAKSTVEPGSVLAIDYDENGAKLSKLL